MVGVRTTKEHFERGGRSALGASVVLIFGGASRDAVAAAAAQQQAALLVSIQPQEQRQSSGSRGGGADRTAAGTNGFKSPVAAALSGWVSDTQETPHGAPATTPPPPQERPVIVA